MKGGRKRERIRAAAWSRENDVSAWQATRRLDSVKPSARRSTRSNDSPVLDHGLAREHGLGLLERIAVEDDELRLLPCLDGPVVGLTLQHPRPAERRDT